MEYEIIEEGQELEFEIWIDFQRGKGDPARVFKAMSGLIESFESINSHLASTYDSSLNATLVLDEIESGSIKAKFRDFIEGLPDEALKEAEWKKIIGHFLLKSKYVLLEWLKDREEIVDREDVRVLEGELVKVAEETDLKLLPAYSAPQVEVILGDIHSVQESLAHLEIEDKAIFRYESNEIEFNQKLNISNEVVRDVLTKEVVSSSGEKIVKVKKPDYLGQSMWAFQYDGRSIEAKITDQGWLSEFQSRITDIKPGDSLRVILYEEISYGYEHEVVHRHYEIESVKEIIKPSSQSKMTF